MRPLDCRLHHITGFEEHKLAADAVLASRDRSRRIAIVFTAAKSSLLYAQYNFRYQEEDEYDLKMLQTVGYLKHAWKILKDSHRLDAIVYAEDEALGRLGDVSGLSGMRFEKVAARLPKYEAVEEKSILSGLFDWMKPKGWLERLEAQIARRAKDDFVDDDALEEPLSDIRMRVMGNVLKAAREDGAPAARELTRNMETYSKLGRYSSQARVLSWYQARAMSNAFSNGPEEVTGQLMGCVSMLNDSLIKVGSWSHVEMTSSIFLDRGSEADLLKPYYSIAEASLDWRVLLDDPNATLRQFVGQHGVWQSVERVAQQSSPDRAALLYGEIARYEDAIGNLDRAQALFKRLLSHPPPEGNGRACKVLVEAELRLAELAAECGNPAAAIAHLDELEQRLARWTEPIGHGPHLLYLLRLYRCRSQVLLRNGDDKACRYADKLFQLLSESRLRDVDPRFAAEAGRMHYELGTAQQARGQVGEALAQYQRALDALRPLISFRYAQGEEEPKLLLGCLDPFMTALKACIALRKAGSPASPADEGHARVVLSAEACTSLKSFMLVFRPLLPGLERLPEYDAYTTLQNFEEAVPE